MGLMVRAFYFALLLGAVVALSSAAFHRNMVWQTRTTVWQDVTLKSPGKARGYYNFGVYMQKYGELEKALELYNQAILLDPDKGEALVNRGNLYDEMLLPRKALVDYARALTVNPSDESAYYNRAVTYQRLGLIGEAQADYSRSCMLGRAQSCIELEKLMTGTNDARVRSR